MNKKDREHLVKTLEKILETPEIAYKEYAKNNTTFQGDEYPYMYGFLTAEIKILISDIKYNSHTDFNKF